MNSISIDHNLDELFQLSPLPDQQHNKEQLDELMLLLAAALDDFPVLASGSSTHQLGSKSSDGSIQQQQVDDQFDELIMMMLAASPDHGNMVISAEGGGGGGDQLPAQNNKSSGSTSHGGDTKKRKIIHRDVERQRRQDMSSLYGSLRSHLPLELLKGKRSISDHIAEAVRYINHLQIRNRALKDKRDELKGWLDPLSNNTTDPIIVPPPENLQNGFGDSTITVKPCMAGVEVTINTDLRRGISLPRVLGFLMKEGLTVIGCTTTRVNERMLHLIESEVSDSGKNTGLSDLQSRLTNSLGKS